MNYKKTLISINQKLIKLFSVGIMRTTFFILLFALFSIAGKTQDSTLVRLKGDVFDASSASSISYFMVINKSTGSGTFGDADGSFTLDVHLNDTILVGAHGYATQNYIILEKNVIHHKIFKKFSLNPIVINLPEVVIIPERELKEIKEDIDDLGYNEKDYRVSGVDATKHPITFLYQVFSKREKSFRKVIELKNEVRRRDLLKELFKKYVAYDIINLSDEDFDDFIDYCNISDELMQSTTQYEFINLIKTRYKGYQIYIKRRKNNPTYQQIHNE